MKNLHNLCGLNFKLRMKSLLILVGLPISTWIIPLSGIRGDDEDMEKCLLNFGV